MLDYLKNIEQGSAAVFPIGTEVEFLEAKRSGEAGYEKWCRYWDEQISVCVLGETLTTNIQGAGSRAATETHSEILEKLIDSDADLQSATWNETLIKWLIEYNFPNANPPRILRPRPLNEQEQEKVKTLKAVRIAKDIENINLLREQGFEPKDIDEHLNELLGLEVIEVERDDNPSGESHEARPSGRRC